MTVERAVAIAFPVDAERRLLIDDIRSAAARAGKADPGERLDIMRFEALSSQLEAWAFQQLDRPDVAVATLPTDAQLEPVLADAVPVPPWLPAEFRAAAEEIVSAGGALVALRLAIEAGEASLPDTEVAPPAPAQRWRSEHGWRGSKAVRERFEEQLKRAVAAPAGTRPEPISPSGIQNKVLTDALREYVNNVEGEVRVDVRVEYRDGSRAQHPFPLRSLRLLPGPVEPHDLELSFALLSIRHTEMDAIVDGAWLRNVQVSQPRTAAETDDLVYATSREQLTALTDDGRRRVKLRIYQTGLETAIVGFYRAVTDHLLRHPGTLSVIPMYFQSTNAAPPATRQDSRSRRRGQGNRRAGGPAASGEHVAQEAQTAYSEGAPWSTALGRSQ